MKTEFTKCFYSILAVLMSNNETNMPLAGSKKWIQESIFISFDNHKRPYQHVHLKWYMKDFIYWTADLKSSKLWSSQLWTQFKQLRIAAWKTQDFNGVWTPWKGSRVQTPLKSWLFQASIRNCLNCVHNCDDHSLLEFTCVLSSKCRSRLPLNSPQQHDVLGKNIGTLTYLL